MKAIIPDESIRHHLLNIHCLYTDWKCIWADQKTGSLLSGKADKQATQSDILPKPQPVYLQDNAPPNRYGNMKVW